MLKKIASNTLAQVFSKIITATISIVLLGLITNYLTIELFGNYNMVFNYIFIFAFLVDLGLYAITIKEISADKKNTEYIFWNILTLRLISAIFVILFSVLIAYFLPWYNSNFILIGIFIASIFTFFSLINSNLLALMQSHMKMEFSIISVVINKLFVLWFTYYLIKHSIFWEDSNIRWNLEWWLLILIWIVAIWMLINMFLNYLYARKITKITLKFDWNYIKKIFLKALPYWIALFLSVVYTKIDIILLSFMEQGIIAETSIAMYSLPLKIMDVFIIIWGFFMNSLLPSLSENYKNKNSLKVKEILINAFKVMYAIWVIIISLWLIFKDSIVKIVANNSYLQITENNIYTSSDAFSVIFFMILFFYLWIIFSYFLISIDKQKKLLKISIILTISNIVWNILLIPIYSFVWAAIVTVITQTIFLYLVYFESKKHINIEIPYKFISIISIIWVIIYYFISYLIQKFNLWIYFNLIYWIIIFIIYSLIIWKIERKKVLFLKR